jgi:hypothetical protein
MRTWECGYRTIFLCEYHLLTGDREVLPAITALTLALARGQGRYGTFGHGFSEPAADGGLHGPIPPYGPVNAAGLIGNLAIVMGRKCGVADPEVAAAIDRGSRFFGYYVDKGAIPYGEHMPWPHHDNNGKNAMAAAFFALQGDRPRETRFFTKMVTASFRNRDYGHTGQGFSYLWGGPGAGMGGPAAAAAFVGEASWHLDLVRRCDGSFTYDGSEQYGPGSTDDDTYFGRSGYYGLSPTASYVLTYALPLRAICLTGRDADESHWLDEGDVAEAVASGRFDLDRTTMAADDLVTTLGDWSPVARGWAAEELARRPEAKGLVPQLIAMARATLTHLLEHQLTVEDVRALGPDILAAATTPCPADTMFRNEIRMAAFKVLAKYRFREGIEAGVLIARTQGGHGSETRTGEIMKELAGYAAAARDAVPRLEELITFFSAECAAGGFPKGPLNDKRIDAVKAAIAAIESSAESPPLRTLSETAPVHGPEK